MKRLFRFASALVFVASVVSAQPVVPGGSGYGMETRAAYGAGVDPTIYRVTNLNDGGRQSLREALEATGPRIVLFEISGTIALASDIFINNPFLTVAGQTAPSPGITLRNHGLFINTTDVLLQHLRIRPGGDTCNSGLQVYGGKQARVILDHLSFSWAQDENLAFTRTNGQNTDATVWRSIVAEGLYRASGSGACSGGGTSNGHGILIAAEAGRVAVIQTLLASNFERNPYMQGGTAVALLNNVIYQWHGPWGVFFDNLAPCESCSGRPWFATVIGNRFIKGPRTTDSRDRLAYTFLYSTNNRIGDMAGNQIFKADNTVANQDGTVNLETNQYSYNPNRPMPPTQAAIPVSFTALSSQAVEGFVLANAGARPADRDAVDARIVRQVKNRGGRFLSSQRDVGGWPDLAVNRRALALPVNAHARQKSGYTALEEWLHRLADEVEGAAPPKLVTVPSNRHKSPH